MERRPQVLACGLLLLAGCARGAHGQQVLHPEPIVVPGPAAWKFPSALPFDAEKLDRREDGLRQHHLDVPLGPAPAVRGFESPTPLATQVLDDPPFPISLNREVTAVKLAASTVAEPTVASDGKRVLLTGNWFAALSSDGGDKFSLVDPATAFPPSAHGEFCCDQVALYSPERETFFWLLQYKDSAAGNVYRVAVADRTGFDGEAWKVVDMAPALFKLGEGLWFDYPDMAVSEDHLFISANVFLHKTFQRSIVMRLDLEDLLTDRPVAVEYVLEEQDGAGSPRFAQGARGSMRWAAHSDPATLFVYRWPATELADVIREEVLVTPWTEPKHGDKQSVGPDGHDWLGRYDSRITAGWLAQGRLGFAWTAARDETYPQPHVRMALIDEATSDLVAEPHIWNDKHAYAYPAVAVGSAGDVAIGLAFGGGAWHPSFAVGFLRKKEQLAWQLATVARGTAGPKKKTWGDYLAVRAEPGAATFLGTGYTLRGGNTYRFARVRVVRFASDP